jgi:hypothetical protein
VGGQGAPDGAPLPHQHERQRTNDRQARQHADDGGEDVAPVARPASADASGAVRSTLTVSPDKRSMTARWERSDDGAAWQPWMHMRFTRMP